jgi:hypothetical protein
MAHATPSHAEATATFFLAEIVGQKKRKVRGKYTAQSNAREYAP